MIFIPEISDAQITEAHKLARRMPRLRHTFTRGGKVYGKLGEILVRDLLKAEHPDHYDYDLLWNGMKLEVKTARCLNPPTPRALCQVSIHNTTQKCDRYVFVRITKDMTKAWVIGSIDAQTFRARAVKLRKGHTNPENRTKIKATCLCVPAALLTPFTPKAPTPETPPIITTE